MLCKLGHQDTCLSPKRLNPKTTQAGKAGEGRHRKHRPEGAQGEWAARESGNQGAREKALGTDDGEIAQEEKQTENNGREQECENGNPARAFNRSNMVTSTGRGDRFSSRILDRPRTKEKEASHGQCKRQPRRSLFPPVTCLVRLCTRKV